MAVALVCLASHHGVSEGYKTRLASSGRGGIRLRLPLHQASSARSQDFRSAEILRLPTEGVDSTEPNLTTEVVSWV
jgi:hypothetical protein